MSADRTIAAVATPQYGVFSIEQALAKGVTRSQLKSRLATGHLIQVYPKVLAISGAPLSYRSRVMAAVLWSRDGAASHRTAARWHALDGIRPSPIEVSIRRSTPSPGELVVHHPVRLPEWQVEEIEGLRVTILERTLLDLCSVGKPWECNDAIDSALRRDPSLLNRLEHLLQVEAKPGRPGIRLLRALTAERNPDLAPPGSVLAGRFLRWLRAEGLPEPIAELEIRGEGGFVKKIDFGYLNEHIGFEVDGYGTHGNKEAFNRDRESDAILIGLGWRIYRITDSLMRQQTKKQRLANSIRAALTSTLISKSEL